MVTADPTMDIAQQPLPLFDGDAALQDPGVALLVEVYLAMSEPSRRCLFFLLGGWRRLHWGPHPASP